MNPLLNVVSPSATDMIRMDHTRVMATFHRYALDASPRTKHGIVEMICLSLEVHAQVEEEIFYPALRAAGSAEVAKAFPEHAEMRALIAALRAMDPASEQYDATFMDLMRAVIHHVADEETMLLPHAEALLADRLGELGRQMSKRRLQLARPRTGAMVRSTARALPPRAILIGMGALFAGAFALRRLISVTNPR
ncbi:MAG TPA: hemerythrin domain-containing protein [Burkholderiales bacterium]|nr:hemerythrin domain-containing protein [Burkholderiales bacterium]